MYFIVYRKYIEIENYINGEVYYIANAITICSNLILVVPHTISTDRQYNSFDHMVIVFFTCDDNTNTRSGDCH